MTDLPTTRISRNIWALGTTSLLRKRKSSSRYDHSFARGKTMLALSREARRRKLTRLMPSFSRLDRVMRGTDRILRAPRLLRKHFLQYRRGTTNACHRSVCNTTPVFHRRHEACYRPKGSSCLSNKETKAKLRLQATLQSNVPPTNVDFVLDTGRFDCAHKIP